MRERQWFVVQLRITEVQWDQALLEFGTGNTGLKDACEGDFGLKNKLTALLPLQSIAI
jgi:hypothetical protein